MQTYMAIPLLSQDERLKEAIKTNNVEELRTAIVAAETEVLAPCQKLQSHGLTCLGRAVDEVAREACGCTLQDLRLQVELLNLA